MLELNLASPFVLAKRATPLLRASKGCIVFITCASATMPFRCHLPYVVSKGGLRQLMRTLALELAPDVLVTDIYLPHKLVKLYDESVISGVDALSTKKKPLRFVEGRVPVYLNMFGGWSAEHSVLLRGLGYRVRMVPPGRGAYVISEDGSVVSWENRRR